jgi:2-isopropylmalate synthase
MARERISLYDTTLRDGAQTHGVDFSLEDKWLIAQQLDVLGIDYIEGGYPGANPTDTRLFADEREFGHARLTAFGMTKRPGRSLANDLGFQALLAAKTSAICLVGKTWDFHVDVALGIPLDENVEGIRDSVAAVVASGREALLDCEHFFDGYKANPDYALRCAKTAHEAGARWVVLCDTNGGTLPEEIEKIVAEVVKHIPGDHVGIHVHNDTDNGVANSLAAVRAGARQIQGTLNGLGERCGNANLTSIIPTLMLKSDYAERFETSVTPEKLRTLTHASRILDEILNRAPNRHAPYVGEAAFAHKGGIHVSAVQKDPRTYEHVPPESVGNRRKLLVSDQAGRSNILAELDRIGIAVPKDDPRVARLLDEVKEREAAGYAYEAADASFELLARRMLGNVPRFFDVDSFRVTVERRHNALGDLVTVSEATVKVRIDGETMFSAGEGNGPELYR